MANGMSPEQKRAYQLATKALANIDEQLRKTDHLPLLHFQRGVVFAVLMNVALHKEAVPPETPPSPL